MKKELLQTTKVTIMLVTMKSLSNTSITFFESHPSQYYANVITFNDEEESKNVNTTTRNQAKVIL